MVQEQIPALPEAFTVIASWILPWAAEPSVPSPQLLQPGNGLKAVAALCFPALPCEECLEVGTKQRCHDLPFVTSQDLMMDGWRCNPTHTQRLSLAAGAQGANGIQGTLAKKRGQDFMGWRMLLAKPDQDAQAKSKACRGVCSSPRLPRSKALSKL